MVTNVVDIDIIGFDLCQVYVFVTIQVSYLMMCCYFSSLYDYT